MRNILNLRPRSYGRRCGSMPNTSKQNKTVSSKQDFCVFQSLEASKKTGLQIGVTKEIENLLRFLYITARAKQYKEGASR